jgi:hypothetical protein
MKIYLASSWRNPSQPAAVQFLRGAGHEVYDFRNPPSGSNGFHWTEIDPDWQRWTPGEYLEALKHPIAEEGFASDFDAMAWADACVLIGPAGISAHLELGWCAGAGKHTAILFAGGEPELMVKMAGGLFTELHKMSDWLDGLAA